MLERIFQIRWIILIVVIFTVLNAIAFLFIGVASSVEGYIAIFSGDGGQELNPGLTILDALDDFLTALVFIIFAMGIAILFLPKKQEVLKDKLPEWLSITNFTDLKLLLWEAVLTTLVVYFVNSVVKRDGNYSWEMLILPGSILMLSLCIYILKK
ncbi:MAG: YqhA family protein [Saprospiraceae bacterium]|nr:YqhA family protein [Saprospiraceae bacterium]